MSAPQLKRMFDWINGFSQLTGAALYLATLIILVIIVFFGARYYFAPGSDRLAARQENEREAIAVLKGQLEEQRRLHKEQRDEDAKEIRELQNRVSMMEERMRLDSEWNRTYRHALANREHILGYAYDNALLMIDAMFEEVPEMPEHYVRARTHMKSADAMRDGIPLPVSPEATERAVPMV